MILDASGKPVRRVVGFNGGHFERDESNLSVAGGTAVRGQREPFWHLRDSGYQQEPFAAAPAPAVTRVAPGVSRRAADD